MAVRYEGESISNQPDKILTDLHNQDFHSVLSHDNKTYIRYFSSFGSLIDNLSRLQARPVSR